MLLIDGESSPGTPSRRAGRAVAIGLVALTVAAACGGQELEGPRELADLGRCPNPLVIQTDFYPQPEHGAVYNLTGGEGRMDPGTGRFRGPLAAEPDLVLEVRPGGPFLGNRSALELMAADDEIFVGFVDTDEAIARHGRHPSTAVVAPLDINPQVLLWDPGTHEIESWADIIETGATISHHPDAPYVDYLVEAGLVDEDQLEDSYDGTPDRFVRSDGAVIQEGLATEEPYVFEEVLAEWGRPVDYLLIHDAGYQPYRGALTILDDRLDGDARACLAAFVPIVQQSIVDFQRDPTSTNELLVDAVTDLDSGWRISPGGTMDSVIQMGSLGIVGNGDNNTIGDFDLDRVDELIVLTSARIDSLDAPDLAAEDVVSNEFIDPEIGL